MGQCVKCETSKQNRLVDEINGKGGHCIFQVKNERCKALFVSDKKQINTPDFQNDLRV